MSLLLILLCGCQRADQSAPAPRRLPPDYRSVSVERVPPGVLVVQSTINEHEEAVMLIDSGAMVSCLDKSFVKEALPNATPVKWGEGETGFGGVSMDYLRIAEVSIGATRFRDVDIAVMDFTELNKRYQARGGVAIDGVIGADLLLRSRATLDFGNSLLYVSEAPKARDRGSRGRCTAF